MKVRMFLEDERGNLREWDIYEEADLIPAIRTLLAQKQTTSIAINGRSGIDERYTRHFVKVSE